MDRLCRYLKTTPTAVARRAGHHHTGIGKIMNGERALPEEQTIMDFHRVLHEMAAEKGKEWHPSWDTSLLNSAGFVTQQQKDDAHSQLRTIPDPTAPEIKIPLAE